MTTVSDIKADVNLTITIRDDDSGLEAVTKLHVYSEEKDEVLKYLHTAVQKLSMEIGVVINDRQEKRS